MTDLKHPILGASLLLAASLVACSSDSGSTPAAIAPSTTTSAAGSTATTAGAAGAKAAAGSPAKTGTGGASAAGAATTPQAGSSSSAGTTGTGNTGNKAGTGNTTSAAGSGTTPVGVCQSVLKQKTQATLPFAVDDFFIPSGFMGANGDVPALKLDAACATGVTAAGKCYTVSFSPTGTGDTWAGIYWNNGDVAKAAANQDLSNWGAVPGAPVAAGATKITFKAWADAAVSVDFFAGLQGDPNADEFQAKQTFALTTTPTEYTLDMTGQTYTCVIGGFGFSFASTRGTTVKFYIDNARWQ